MSIREQERRQKQVEKRIEGEMRRADREVRAAAEERSRQADLRAQEVVRRIEKGDADPRPLPGMREDSMESMESMGSMESMKSMESMESGQTVMEIDVGSETQEAGEGMPLEGAVPYTAEEAGEDLAGRVTEESGGHGDPHAEGKVDQMGQRMFEE